MSKITQQEVDEIMKKSAQEKAGEIAFKVQKLARHDPDVITITGSTLLMMGLSQHNWSSVEEFNAYLNDMVAQIRTQVILERTLK